MRKVIFHIDVNSAYLSWEATRRVQNGAPDLRLIPSAIGGDRDKRTGVILAKSIPAKKYKITTGEPVGMALRKCPELVLAKPDFKLYVQCSRAFVAICRKYAPVVEQVSIDECFCDFDNTERIYPDPLELAYLIKDEIRDTLGFTVNVGVSENKLLAKMASDFEKPDKVQTLYPSEIAEKMWPLPVGELFTVGKATAERLKKARIETIGDLAHTDQTVLEEMLIKSLDLQGRVLLANGVNQDAVCEVRDAIRHFNEESKISNNYAASLNGVSVGELAAVRYFPTQEALEIQFFWEAAVNDASIVTSTEPTPPLPEDTPEAKAERYSILREKRQKEREEKEERCKAAKAAFEQREAAAKQNYDAVVEHLNARKQQFRRELDAVISQKQQEYFRQREETLYTLQSEQARLSAELSKLGPFHLGRKNEIRKALDALSQKLQQLQNPYGEAAALNGYRADAEAAVRAYEEKIQRYLQDRFPKINIPQRTDNEAAAAGRPGNEPLTLEELNDVYEALRNRGIATRQQLMDDVDWYDARRFFQIINALVACYSAEEKRDGDIGFYQATGLEPVEPVPVFREPVNRYAENPNASALPIPAPDDCAPGWLHCAAGMNRTAAARENTPAQQSNPIPRPMAEQNGAPGAAQDAPAKENLSSTDKKEAILAALLQGEAMRVSDMLEQIPELAGETPQQVLVYCRSLLNEDLISSEIRDRTTYFKC